MNPVIKKRQRGEGEDEDDDEGKRGGPRKNVVVHHDDHQQHQSPPPPPPPSNCGISTNPMMNDVILKRLFELVVDDHRDLNTCREVCSQWYGASLPAWYKYGPPIKLKSFDSLAKFVNQVHHQHFHHYHGPTTTSAAAANCSRKIDGIWRYSKFHLNCDLGGGGGGTYAYLLTPPHDTFWTLGGWWMTHLTLRHVILRIEDLSNLTCSFTPKLKFLDVEFQPLLRPPNMKDGGGSAQGRGPEEGCNNINLKELHIDYFEPGREQLPSVDWKALLSHYPMLEHLHVGSDLSSAGRMEEILVAIKEIRRDDGQDKLKLKSLIWHSNRTRKPRRHPVRRLPLQSIADTCRSLRLLDLRSFRIEFDGDPPQDADEDHIKTLFSIWARSLKKLEFHKDAQFIRHPPFRGLEQLQTLHMTGYPVANLTFLADLPSLRSLTLWGNQMIDCYYASSLISSTTTGAAAAAASSPSLSHFSCNYVVKWTEADVARLRQLMPNLSRLSIWLYNDSFRQVCQLWPRLEQLGVYGDKVGDYGIGGITALSELSRFSIDSLGNRSYVSREWTENVITAASVSTLLSLPRLKHLDLLTNRGQINSATKATILREIPFAKVDPDDGGADSDDDDEFNDEF